jgi:hypothetical protein
MILNKKTTEAEKLLKINNDIYRIITLLNKDKAIRKLLVNTGSNPLQMNDIPETQDLRDKQISRTPLVPYNEEDSSIIVVTFVNGITDPETDSIFTTLVIDVFTPGNQWIINEGVRPLNIAHVIDNLMQFELTQTDGVRYRLVNIVNSQLSDVLLGYRMIYESTIND